MIPKLSNIAFCSSCLPVKKLKRRARFAPEQLAQGLSSGIVDSQANLVHGAFDDPSATTVDPYVDISSDKFTLMQAEMAPVSVDPTPTTNSTPVGDN